MTPQQQAEALAMEAAEAINDAQPQSLAYDVTELLRAIPLVELLECVEELRHVYSAHDSSFRGKRTLMNLDAKLNEKGQP